MKEVSAPVIGIALILSAVFIPVAFIPGLTGQMYQQFALTIAISVLLSAFSALSLSPALAAMLLKPAKPAQGARSASSSAASTRASTRATNGYVGGARSCSCAASILTIVLVGVVAVGAGLLRRARCPPGFIPEEDQGIIGVNVQLPPAASLERTSAVLAQVEEILGKTEGIDSYQTIGGYGVVTSTYQPNFGTIFVRLKPWEERHGAELHVRAIMAKLQARVRADPRGDHLPVQHPDHLGLRRVGRLQLPASGSQRHPRASSSSASCSRHVPRRRRASGRARQPLHLVRSALPAGRGRPRPGEGAQARRAGERGLSGAVRDASAEATSTTSTVSGACSASTSRPRPTTAQKPEDIGEIYVRSETTGDMIPLATLVTITAQAGTELTNRFNLLRSVEISGVPAPATPPVRRSRALEDVFKETMPPEMGFAYSSMSYQEKMAPPAGPTLVLAIVFVFLLLAALYESWRLPWAVLLGSPLVALGAFFGVWLMGYDNNVYVQIGNIMLIGLAAKNAILIVEFAKAKHDERAWRSEEAALESARLRFRPILMTAFAFILGVVPLMRAERRRRGRAERDGHRGLLGHAGRDGASACS